MGTGCFPKAFFSDKGQRIDFFFSDPTGLELIWVAKDWPDSFLRAVAGRAGRPVLIRVRTAGLLGRSQDLSQAGGAQTAAS